jgi:hypothetical protein
VIDRDFDSSEDQLPYREELLRAFKDLDNEARLREIVNGVGKQYAELTVTVNVNWFGKIETESLETHLVIGETQLEVTDDFDRCFREVADTEKLLTTLKDGLREALGDMED